MSPTQLLVSVRNPQEARIAAEFVEVLDIKEPAAGSLGCAGEAAIAAITGAFEACDSLSLSAALGELSEWNLCEPIRIPKSLQFLKIGLAAEASRTDWRSRWTCLRRRFEEINESHFQWIAVGYADFEAAESPPLQAVLEGAFATNCAGFLIDTWKKDGSTLWDHRRAEELRQLITAARKAGLRTAIAGRIQRGDIPRVVDLNADLLAIRSAACAGGNRTDHLDRETLADFASTLRSANGARGHFA